MTVVIQETHTAQDVEESPSSTLALWHFRAGAFAIDVVPLCAVLVTLALVSFTVPLRGMWWWVSMCVIGFGILVLLINRLLLPVITGWSLGRALCGIVVVRRDGESIGAWRLLLRELAHLLDIAPLLLGWLWPLWDSGRRTFADMLVHTAVRSAELEGRPASLRRWTAVAMLTAAAVCVGGAVVSYAEVFSRDRATEESRAQIATQGPRMVAQMLTYDPKSLHDDFARAQSLATARYRGQLAAQQEAVEKGHPIINEYWVTDSSIQSATPDRATMLLFLQGRRGAPPEERYISATVRTSFARDGNKQWRVDDLTVLTKPRPPGSGR